MNPKVWTVYPSTSGEQRTPRTGWKNYRRLIELLKLLNQQEVRYLVVGGYAVTYHGYPRTTGDLNIWIELSDENARRLVEVLEEVDREYEDGKAESL